MVTKIYNKETSTQMIMLLITSYNAVHVRANLNNKTTGICERNLSSKDFEQIKRMTFTLIRVCSGKEQYWKMRTNDPI